MDGAGTGDNKQPVVGTVKHRADLGPGALNRFLLRPGERELVKQRSGGQQRLVADNSGITDA
jgi:hypothetical protein